MSKNKILILEEDIHMGRGLQDVLLHLEYNSVLFQDSEKALKQAKIFKPDLAICNIHLGGNLKGIHFVKEVCKIHPQIEIIYITEFSSMQMIEKASITNPLNYIIKPWNRDQVKISVQLAFDYIEKKYLKEDKLSHLSLTEYKIIDLIAKHKKSKEIGEILFISEKTVRNHRYNIIKKLQIPRDNYSLLKWALTYLKSN
ncbi:MAG: DNA-binding response regulator [Bacteroidetes bacterium]|nr:DNA-binding response regulator [Bacteroidota bacterium]